MRQFDAGVEVLTDRLRPSSRTTERITPDYQRAVTLGILGRTVCKKSRRCSRLSRDGRGDYLDDATYELGRTFVASGALPRGGCSARTFRREPMPIRPTGVPALSESGTGLPEPGRQETVAFATMICVVEDRSQSSDAERCLAGDPGDLRRGRRCRRLLRLRPRRPAWKGTLRRHGARFAVVRRRAPDLPFGRCLRTGEPSRCAATCGSYPKGYYTGRCALSV